MKRHGTILICLGLLASAGARASVDDSRYDRIALRNAFRLVEPKTTEVRPVPEPLPSIVLNGITTIVLGKLALLTVQVPNQPLEFCILAEGQKQGEIQVLRIDEETCTVQVSNRGTIQTLDFKNNGARPGSTPSAAAPIVRPVPRQQVRSNPPLIPSPIH